MKTFVGFDFYTSHTRVSGDLCLSTIIEGISNAIDKFRDAYRLYRVMGLSNNVQDMKSYALDIGVVKAHINIGDDNSHVSFDLTDTIISDMLQSYDFKSRGLSYTGLLDNLDAYNQCVNKIINVLIMHYHSCMHYLLITYSWVGERPNSLVCVRLLLVVLVLNNLLCGRVHLDCSKHVSFDFTYSLVASVDFIDSFDVRPARVCCSGIKTIDSVLDILEMISFTRDMIRSNSMYDFINQYGNTDDLDYFKGKECVSKILRVVNHKNDLGLEYYKKIELDSNISAMMSYGTQTFRGSYLDCKLDFHVSSDAFLRKVMGSAFFDTNRLEEILYTSLYLFGRYAGCWE